VYLSRNAHIVVSNHRKPSKVIETGSFKYIRHTIYLASLLVYFGLTISTMSLISFVVLVLSILFHNYIFGYEEKLLINKFGAIYKDYMNRTGRWIPKRGRTLSK
jgi:protein-S-isoprenylcysteine O-methyltransferase Ste14